jgi:hypothetical protein
MSSSLENPKGIILVMSFSQVVLKTPHPFILMNDFISTTL